MLLPRYKYIRIGSKSSGINDKDGGFCDFSMHTDILISE